MTASKEQRLRREVAAEAARLMANEGVRDYLAAKRKAATRLGISDSRFMPRNTEIKTALESYQRLFQSGFQPDHVRTLRETALQAMQFFARFQPRLVGDVLEGIAGPYADITLHLFTDAVEEVTLFMMEERIPFESTDRRVKMARDRYEDVPVFHFAAGAHPIELVVFPVDGLRQAPCSPVDGKPMRRASISAVQSLLRDEIA